MEERKFTFHSKVRLAGQNAKYFKYSKPYEVVDYAHIEDAWCYLLLSASGERLGWYDEKDLIKADE